MQQNRSPQPALDEDEEDRQNRFLGSSLAENGTATLRERAASQPPRRSEQNIQSSPSQPNVTPSSFGSGGTSPWSGQRLLSPTRGGSGGLPQPIPMRSSSFSAHPQSQFSSAMRDRAFPSTFEDDESEISDTYDERFFPSSLNVGRGRTYTQDITRSRSQSLANTRAGAVGSPYLNSSAMASWNESSFSHPLNIPGSRYGEIKPPGTSRYGSLGTLGRSPTNIHVPSSPVTGGSVVGNGYSHRQTIDPSNMSPFVRDVGQILVDDSPFRELWSGMNPPRDENGGGGSGTTSRRHSVSVVQPRRGNVVGFNAPGAEGNDEPSRPAFTQAGFGRGGLMISDDELASDLGLLNINPEPRSPSSQQPTSQPSSLPIYAPLSRSPPSADRLASYLPMNQLSIQTSASYSRQQMHTPSDGGTGGGSPPRPQFDQQLAENQFLSGSRSTQQQGQTPTQQSELTARYIPGQGIQYLPQHTIAMQNHNVGQHNGGVYTRERAPSYTGSVTSPVSPSSARAMHAQHQSGFYPQPIQRRPSDAQSPLNELGKGLPLHAVPASWPLYIVEFKAGRTDLYYLTDLSLDVRVGDLVIVEADRGKDLGKVINDSITLAEVEAFQKQQMAMSFSDGQPTSPGGGQPVGKKEINPKMIYAKAQQQDAHLLVTKLQDEMKALQLCQSKVRAKKLPMEVVDAEYQWDRRKLTFYFVAEKRIDFRELVRELFRLYKTRIWMASLQGGPSVEQ
ncbi:hypothetical protein CCMSSC00406_0009256 [Pleurotus cornucopiae]|uniref:Uncharacterized protein n=1 Tax=Pleurotus cornucopiae TaxID=5321 RepID=A0ACB7IZZ3_PLECO|nr:hypothetical protein CCMSSC00406_0009256 [Pleurotus cornucopiae]